MGATNIIQIPFQGGLDEKTASEYLDPAGRQVEIQNGNFAKVGAIEKRLGLKHLSNDAVPGSDVPDITKGVRTAGWSRSSLTVMGQGGLYTYTGAENGLVGVAELPAVRPVRRPISTSATPVQPTLVDMPYNGTTLRIAAYYDGSYNVIATVTDISTGDVVLEPTEIVHNTGSIGSLTLPILGTMFYLPNAAVGKQCVISYTTLTDGKVYVLNYNPVTNTFSAGTNIFTPSGVGTVGTWDIVPFIGDPSGGYVAFYTSGTSQVTIKYFSYNHAAVVTKTFTMSAGRTFSYPCYAVCTYGATVGQEEHCWFLWASIDVTNHFEYWVWETTGDGLFTNVHAPGTLFAPSLTLRDLGGACRVSRNILFLQIFQTGIQTDSQQGPYTVKGHWYTVRDTGAAILQEFDGPTPLGYYPTARPFFKNGYVHQVFTFMLYLQAGVLSDDVHSQQITQYLCKYRDITATHTDNVCLPVATVAPRQVDAAFTLIYVLLSLGRLPFMSKTDPAATDLAVGLKTNGIDYAALAGAQGPSWSVDYFFDDANLSQLYHSSELGTELHISSGVPFIADGNVAFEDCFFNYPEFTYVKYSTTTGNSMDPGVYTYAVCYSYIDSAGLLHRSAPSFTGTITLPKPGGSECPEVRITPCPATWRDVANPGTVFAEVFRTQADGSTFYLLDRISVSNTTAADIVYGPDNWSDSSMVAGGVTLLYTTGGVLDSVNPPSAAYQIVHKNRIAIVDETLRNVWFTKEFSEGEVPGFNEALIIPFPDGGDITALGSMDDKFIAFKATSIWVMYGDGPSDTGSGSDWSIPQRIASDVGSISWQSVVLTPRGLMFQAANGLYLLGRDLQVSFIGKNVIDTLIAYPTVTSATLVPNSTHVRFTCTNGSTSVTIIYDYLLDMWTTHTYARLSAPIASACLTFSYPQQYTILTTDGEIWQERLPGSAHTYCDDDVSDVAHYVITTVKSAWIKTQGLQGYQRARRVIFYGDRQEISGLKMDLSVNYQDDIIQTGSWPSNVLDKLPIPGQVEMHVDRRYNKEMALQVTMSDSADAVGALATGQGFRFVGIGVELDSIGPRYRQVPVLGRK